MPSKAEVAARVEEAIAISGVDPALCKSTPDDQWNLKRGDFEIWIDLWHVEEHDRIYFQVMAPLANLPKETNSELLLELLDTNYQLVETTVVTFNHAIYLRVIREADTLTAETMYLTFSRVGYYLEVLEAQISQKYQLSKVEHRA